MISHSDGFWLTHAAVTHSGGSGALAGGVYQPTHLTEPAVSMVARAVPPHPRRYILSMSALRGTWYIVEHQLSR